jgi:transcription elongation factor
VKVQTDCKKEVYKPLGKSFYVWKEMMFRNGMLYHQFNTSKLVIENVSPMLEEVRKFQVDTTASNELLQTYDSDQDEWDLLPDSTVLKTVCNDKQLKVQIGDRCKVQSGQFQNCKGIIQSINTETGIVQMITEEKVPVPIKVHASLLLKFFEVGEQVRILQGLHSGQAGQVIDIVKPELKHAIVLLEHSKVEHKVLISNLRRREELDPNCKHTLSQFLTKGESTTIKEKGQTVKEVYSVGDLVVFNNHTEVGLVLSVEHDCLKVLLENNTTSVVRLSFVQKKIAFETKGVNGRVATRNRIVTTDRFSNVISIRSTVKPTEHSCPFYNCLGEVRAIYKNSLYVMF